MNISELIKKIDETNFTPGDWSVLEYSDPPIIAVERDFGIDIPIADMIAQCNCSDDPIEDSTLANTRLVKNSKRLLHSIKECLPDLSSYANNHGPGPDRRLAELYSVLSDIVGE